MDEKNVQEQTHQAAPSPLMSKPERHSGRPAARLLSIIILLIGAAVVVGGGIVLVTQLVPRSSASTSNSGQPASKKGSGLPAGCTGARIPIDMVKQQTAAGLRLTVAQVTTQAHAGKTIAQIATAQGLSAAQLHTIELHALQTANARWLSMGCIQQQDINDNMRRDTGTAAYMNEEFTDMFKQP